MASVDDLNTVMGLADAAIAAESWSAAMLQLMRAKAMISGMPDLQHGDASVRWRGENIDALINLVKQNKAAGVGIQRSKFIFKEPRDCGSDCGDC